RSPRTPETPRHRQRAAARPARGPPRAPARQQAPQPSDPPAAHVCMWPASQPRPRFTKLRVLGGATSRRTTMILPKVRDLRFVTIRRGGTLTDSDHQLLALWAAACAEHVLGLFESARPADPRPRQAIEHARAWVRGAVTMTQARAAGGHAMAAARDL